MVFLQNGLQQIGFSKPDKQGQNRFEVEDFFIGKRSEMRDVLFFRGALEQVIQCVNPPLQNGEHGVLRLGISSRCAAAMLRSLSTMAFVAKRLCPKA